MDMSKIQNLHHPLLYEIISNNFSQRGVGGELNTSRFNVENITQNVAQISCTLEIVWAILTPKNLKHKSKVKKKLLLPLTTVNLGLTLLYTGGGTECPPPPISIFFIFFQFFGHPKQTKRFLLHFWAKNNLLLYTRRSLQSP